MTDLYLASQSPRRRELLAQLGVRFEPLSLSVPERRASGETPEAYVERLALDKARAGREQLTQAGRPAAPVLGSDTLGVCADRVLEKPGDEAQALAMWRLMSGRAHRVMTAVAVCDHEREAVVRVDTDVVFRLLDEAQMRAYWATGEPRDKAGGYGIQGLGGAWVERIEGSHSAVVGLPLVETTELLERFGVPWWGSAPEGARSAQSENQ